METNQEHFNLLLVEDQEDFACVVRDVLGDSASPFTVTHVDRLETARAKLAAVRYDALLLDLNLPDSRGLETCSAIQHAAPSTPVVVLTGLDDERLALESVAMGMQDYIVKGRVDWWLLARIVRHAIERKRAELALREREEFFRLISENMGDLIVVLDLEGRRLYNSPSYRTILGDPEKLVGTDSFAEIHPDDRERIRHVFSETLRTGLGQRAEYRMVLPDGSVRHLESRGNAIRDSRGEVIRVVVVSRDVTEHKIVVDTLRQAVGDLNRSQERAKDSQSQEVQAEKLNAVSTFAADLAGDVINPLQAIRLGIEFLSKFRASDPSNSDKVLAEMTTAIQRADAVIRGLVDFSAFSKPEIKFESLNGVARIALATVENELRELHIETRFDPEANLPLARFEERTIRHVLINLFMHSMSVMPEGGRLEVTTRVRPGSFSEESSWDSSDATSEVEVEVRDSGAALLGNFPPFSAWRQGTAEGHATPSTTLSLAVLRRIVELCGGELRIVSEPGFGNRFQLRFPVGPGLSP